MSFFEVFEVLVAFGVYAGFVWLVACLVGEERARGFRLPYEQPRHVRLCPFDQDASS